MGNISIGARSNESELLFSIAIEYGRSFDSLLKRGGKMVFSEKGGERKIVEQK